MMKINIRPSSIYDLSPPNFEIIDLGPAIFHFILIYFLNSLHLTLLFFIHIRIEYNTTTIPNIINN